MKTKGPKLVPIGPQGGQRNKTDCKLRSNVVVQLRKEMIHVISHSFKTMTLNPTLKSKGCVI